MTSIPTSVRAISHQRGLLPAAVALSLLQSPAYAITGPDTHELETMVITASGYEQKTVDAPASISVIDNAQLQRKRYSNLAQALADVEGVDVLQNTGKTGGLNISIRGMPSAYTLVLIDGRRQNNAGDITPNGFGETATSFIPPMSAIERIEVIRGPMSTLYGSDAVGGVVNIITRAVPTHWSGAANLHHTIQENSDYGASGGFNAYFAGPIQTNVLGLALRGDFHDRRESALRFADGSPVSRRGVAPVAGRRHTLGVRLALTPAQNHSIILDLDAGRQRYENNDCQLGTLDGWRGDALAGCIQPSDQAAGYADRLRFNRDQAVLGYHGQIGPGILDSSLTWKSTHTHGRTVPGTISLPWTGFPSIVGGAARKLKSRDLILDSKYVTPIGEHHMVTLGGQWLDATVIDGLASEKFAKSAWALFVEDEWKLGDALNLTLGGRYEDHESFGGHFSPRAYLVWSANDAWTVKGGVGRGYRTPSVNQLHDGINGATRQGTILTIGSPHLEPETSTNTEIGVYFDNQTGFDANLTLFRTAFKDLISAGTPIPNCRSTTTPGLPGCLDFGPGFTQDSFAQSINIDEAQSHGAELAARWQLNPAWTISARYTYTDTEQNSGIDKGAPLTSQAKHMAHASLDWTASERLRFWLLAEHYGKRERFTNLYANLSPDEQAIIDAIGPLKAYSQFHLGAAFQLTPALGLNAVVYNLSDKNFLTGRSYLTSAGNPAWGAYYTQTAAATTGTAPEGRRLWLSLNLNF